MWFEYHTTRYTNHKIEPIYIPRKRSWGFIKCVESVVAVFYERRWIKLGSVMMKSGTRGRFLEVKGRTRGESSRL